MKMLEIKVMRGPNYWSNYRKHLIVIKLDLEELETGPTHKIDGFYERIKKLLPSLLEHECSEGHKGGFFERIQQGTWMGHVIEHIALELQTLAGMKVGYGRTRSTEQHGVYNVVFSYLYEDAGRYAGKAAIRIAQALVDAREYDLEADLNYLRRIYRRQRLGPSTGSIVEEAVKRQIPYRRLNNNSFILFGHGFKLQKIRATIADSTAGIGIEIAKDKDETKTLLQSAHIPTPKGVLIYDEDDLKESLPELNFPLVIKPYNGNHGRGITTNITTVEQAMSAFKLASAISTPVILEAFIKGEDYRLILVNYKLVAAAKRSPAMITGDGKASITELIELVNRDPLRGEGHQSALTEIELDENTSQIIADKGLTLGSILPQGENLVLKHTANISSGGTSEDVTDKVHPFNVFLAERVARMLNLNICGIDIVARSLEEPLTLQTGAIVEVNAGPGLRMHQHPSKGLPRNVARHIIEMMFPSPDDGRIPLVAITGTNGKTTTTRLVAHMAQTTGHRVGYTTTDGIFIQGHNIFKGDCSGPLSAQTVLSDPTIDFAVLECARGGILRSGLAFETSDISIVTNITADHLGLKGINSLEEMAKVKIVVPRTTKKDGYAILNADDDLVFDMEGELDCRIALFTMQESNKRVTDHCDRGGLAAMVENGYLTICQGQWKTRIELVTNIPLSLGGRSDCMVRNLMAAALVGMIQNFSTDHIRKAFATFLPSPEQTPGRMNLFNFTSFDLMIDYAHNTDGFLELKKFMDNTRASKKTGIISATGDRRDEDIRMIGTLAAEMFDEIIIRHDKDLRGRTSGEITTLIMEGIAISHPGRETNVISDELVAIQWAIDHAQAGSFIMVCTDRIDESIDYVQKALANDKQKIEKVKN